MGETTVEDLGGPGLSAEAVGPPESGEDARLDDRARIWELANTAEIAYCDTNQKVVYSNCVNWTDGWPYDIFP